MPKEKHKPLPKKNPHPHYYSLDYLDRRRRLMLGLVVERGSSVIPFGYKISEDLKYYIPIQEELEALYKASVYYLESPSRQCAEWLTAATGRYISHFGFQKIMRQRRPIPELMLSLAEREHLYANPRAAKKKTKEVSS